MIYICGPAHVVEGLQNTPDAVAVLLALQPQLWPGPQQLAQQLWQQQQLLESMLLLLLQLHRKHSHCWQALDTAAQRSQGMQLTDHSTAAEQAP